MRPRMLPWFLARPSWLPVGWLIGARHARRQIAEKIAIPGGVHHITRAPATPRIRQDDLLAQLQFFRRHGQTERGKALEDRTEHRLELQLDQRQRRVRPEDHRTAIGDDA
jgi:hypothetical protein